MGAYLDQLVLAHPVREEERIRLVRVRPGCHLLQLEPVQAGLHGLARREWLL